MPINQPATVIQRPFNNNNVNIASSILTPFAGALGQMAGQGVKDLFGIQSEQEKYYSSEAAKNMEGLASKATATYRERLASPDMQGREGDKEFKRQSGIASGLSGEALDAWVETSQGEDPLTENLRNTGKALGELNKNDKFPTPGQAGPAAPFATAAASGGMPQAPSLPKPPAPQAPQTVGALQQGAQGQLASAPTPPVETLPQEVKTEIAPAPAGGLPEVTPSKGTEAPAPQMDPAAREKFSKDLQAYMIRQGGYASLYRQMATAATKGTMDEKQMAFATGMSNMRREGLTGLMQTVAPLLGMETTDLKGNPITGAALDWGLAWSHLQGMTAEVRKAERAKDPETFGLIQQAANKYIALRANMGVDQALKLDGMIQKAATGRILSPEGWTTSVAADRAHEYKKVRDKVADSFATRELDMKQQDLLSVISTRKVATARQQAELDLFQQFAPEEAKLKLKSAQQSIQAAAQKMGLELKASELDELTTTLGLYTSLEKVEGDREDRFYVRQEKKEAEYLKAMMKQDQDIQKLIDDNNLTTTMASNAIKKYQQKGMGPVDAWFKLPENADKVPLVRDISSANDRLDVFVMHQPGMEAYKNYKTELNRMQESRDNMGVLIQGIRSQQAPETGGDTAGLKRDILASTNQKMQERIIPGLRNEAKAALKEAGPSGYQGALANDPTLVNRIVSGTKSTGNGIVINAIWTEHDSAALLELARASNGTRIPAAALGEYVTSKGKLKDIYKDKWGSFYNAYDKLLTELK